MIVTSAADILTEELIDKISDAAQTLLSCSWITDVMTTGENGAFKDEKPVFDALSSTYVHLPPTYPSFYQRSY